MQKAGITLRKIFMNFMAKSKEIRPLMSRERTNTKSYTENPISFYEKYSTTVWPKSKENMPLSGRKKKKRKKKRKKKTRQKDQQDPTRQEEQERTFIKKIFY